MTRQKIPDPHTALQAALVLQAFERYLASPGRCVVLSRDGAAFRVSLEDTRHTRGASLVDAAAQAATAIIVDERTP